MQQLDEITAPEGTIIVRETAGNWPCVAVSRDWSEAYELEDYNGLIHTDRPGRPNYCFMLVVAEIDIDDVADDEVVHVLRDDDLELINSY